MMTVYVLSDHGVTPTYVVSQNEAQRLATLMANKNAMVITPDGHPVHVSNFMQPFGGES